MWMSYSPDLRHWGSHKLMLEARRGALVGCEQDRALAAAHRNAAGLAGDLPRRAADGGRLPLPLGLALFDLHAPERCLKRGDEWVFGPEEAYEQRGDVDNVVFPCGSPRPRRRHPAHLLRRRGHKHRAGHRQCSRHAQTP